MFFKFVCVLEVVGVLVIGILFEVIDCVEDCECF